MNRIHFLFCRLTVKQSLLAARDLQLLDKLDHVLGRHVDIDGMVSTINAPTGVFNVLSVGLFVSRLILNVGLILKHTLAPSEKESDLAIGSRFSQELSKRHPQMLNDIVWASVNLSTNYSSVVQLSAPVANWLTAGFLLFDASLLVYRRHLAENDYLLKKSQYLAEKRHYETLMGGDAVALDDMKNHQKHYTMLDEQLKQLEINWQTTSATFLFNVAAAAILMGGFSASLLLATPVAAFACYLCCSVAVALYVSDDSFKKYKETSLMLQQYELEERDTTYALQKMQGARSDFILTLVKNITMPLLIVTTFAVCWEAALILTAAYIGYESLKGYFKSPSNDVYLEENAAQGVVARV